MAGKGSLSEPVRPHWFYCPPAGEKSPWLPLSYEDSHKLEEAYAWSQELGQEQEKDVVVPVEGSRYDVRLKERSRHAVYWSEPPSEVRRGLWFYKGSKESGYTPYPEDASHVLEEAYRSAVALNEWRKKVELPTGGTIFLQSPKLITQLPSTPAKDKQPAAPTPPSAAPTDPTPSRVVVRGLENVQIDIPEGEPDTVDHLVFMVHGIGPTCDLRMRTLVHCVNDFRSASLGLINSHFRETEGLSGIGRVEFLPITWHDVLHSDTGVDKDMERITLPSISVLRHFGNDTLLDVFFYNSPKYCQVIVDTVASDINRLHALFLQRHPGFTGAVSLAGHSLGSIILFDLLTNQKKSTEEEVVAEESDDSCQSDASVMTSDESVTASDESVTASDMSVTASDESETASDESVTASDESVMAFDESVTASDESVTASDWPESLEDILRGRGLEEHLHVLQREQVDSESLLLCTENDLKDLGIPLGPRKKILDLAKKFKRSRAGTSLPVPNGRVAQETAGPPPHGTRIPEGTSSSSTISYHCSGVGTGQVSVNYPQLAFSPQAFFALGSPIGMFLTVRGLKRMAPDYSLPTCKSFYNIYHPYDPVAYRIEPLVLPAGVELPPVLLPHYKGRKRMHLELRDGLTRVSSEVLGSLRNVWQVFSQVPNSALPLLGQGSDAAFNTSSDTQDDGMSVATGTSQEAQRKDVKVGMLNGGRRFDYVLQEKPIEIFNQYLFAIQSHLCYWESEDTALLVLREIYEQQKAPTPHPTHAAGGDVVM